MSKEIKVNEMPKALGAEEVDSFLESYKKQNPAKYEIKLKAGEFDKLKKSVK